MVVIITKIIDDLEKYNITINNIVNSAMELCICENNEIEQIKIKLEKEIISQLNNINVSTLIIASILLDKEGKNNNLPFNYNDDPNNLYSDEVIGMAIANEISGTKAIFNFKWYDKKKPGIIGELDKNGFVFLDDAIAGLCAGCMSKIFSYY